MGINREYIYIQLPSAYPPPGVCLFVWSKNPSTIYPIFNQKSIKQLCKINEKSIPKSWKMMVWGVLGALGGVLGPSGPLEAKKYQKRWFVVPSWAPVLGSKMHHVRVKTRIRMAFVWFRCYFVGPSAQVCFREAFGSTKGWFLEVPMCNPYTPAQSKSLFQSFQKVTSETIFGTILGVIWEGFGIILGPVGLILGPWVDFWTKKRFRNMIEKKHEKTERPSIEQWGWAALKKL